ncbi:MAG: LVIVD repeat-containing protein [Candidatus Limnocylindria bacterium]
MDVEHRYYGERPKSGAEHDEQPTDQQRLEVAIARRSACAASALVATQVGAAGGPPASKDLLAARLVQAALGVSGPNGASEPAGRATRQVGGLAIPEGLNGDVWAHEGFAYVGTWSGPCPGTGVKVIDATNPAQPEPAATLGSYANTSDEDVEVVSVTTPAFSGDLLATGLQDCGLEGEVSGKTGVDPWDVTDASNPSHLGFFDTGAFGTHEVSLTQQPSGRVFALAAVPFSEITSGGTVGDFQLIEVTDPRNPVRTDDWGAAKDGGLPFGSPLFGLPAPFDCTPPVGAPDLWRGHFPAVFGHSASPSADGSTAYVAYWDAGGIIVDISNPDDVRMVGRTVYPPDSEGDTHSTMPNGNSSLLVTTDEDFSPGELVAAGEPKEPGDTWGFARIWGISDPANPVHLSDFATPHSLTNNTSGFYSAHNPQIRGDRLYLSWYSDGLRIVDISNPAQPREVAFYRPKPTLDPTGVFANFGPGGAHPIPFVWGAYPSGGQIYLSDINFGLYIVEQTR